MSTTEPASTCPIHEFNHYAELPFGEKLARYDDLRDEAPVIRNEFANGHYIVTRYEDILKAYQNAKVFSNTAV
ncbi:cytochrome P450, partial [Streptomyces sp. SID10244]|nr:cytochrome P450 [Streptomyces sp. SID10244]